MARVEVVDLETYKDKASTKKPGQFMYHRFSYDTKSRLPKESEVSSAARFCTCQQPENPDRLMVCCESCSTWFHGGAHANRQTSPFLRHFHDGLRDQIASGSRKTGANSCARCAAQRARARAGSVCVGRKVPGRTRSAASRLCREFSPSGLCTCRRQTTQLGCVSRSENAPAPLCPQPFAFDRARPQIWAFRLTPVCFGPCLSADQFVQTGSVSRGESQMARAGERRVERFCQRGRRSSTAGRGGGGQRSAGRPPAGARRGPEFGGSGRKG